MDQDPSSEPDEPAATESSANRPSRDGPAASAQPRALAVICDIIDPDVIVVGGGMSNIDALYPAVQAKLIAHVFSDFVGAKVVKNKHGDSSGVRGAAWLFTPEEAR